MSAPLLEARALTLALGGRPVLAGVDLDLGPGEVVLIRGASGSGKSTLLRVLAGLQDIERGEIRFRGQPLAAISPRVYRRQAGFLPQRPVMAAGTVGDNLALGPAFLGRPLGAAQRRALLERAGLTGDFDAREARRLSGGEQLRVALARALALEPQALLLDEPTAALDDATARDLLALLRALSSQGVGLAVVSHDARAAEGLVARQLELAAGQLRGLGA